MVVATTTDYYSHNYHHPRHHHPQVRGELNGLLGQQVSARCDRPRSSDLYQAAGGEPPPHEEVEGVLDGQVSCEVYAVYVEPFE